MHFYLRSRRELSTKDNVFYSVNLTGTKNIIKQLKAHKNSSWRKIDKSNLPSGNGVYVLIVKDNNTKKKEVAYIGSSKSLQIRLYCHHIFRFLTEMLESNFSVQALVWKTPDFRRNEGELICKFQPFLNDAKYHARIKIENDKWKRNRLRRQYDRELKMANSGQILDT